MCSEPMRPAAWASRSKRATASPCCGDRGVQHLDRDAAVDARVLALVDGAHAALADQADDAVLPVDDVAVFSIPK